MKHLFPTAALICGIAIACSAPIQAQETPKKKKNPPKKEKKQTNPATKPRKRTNEPVDPKVKPDQPKDTVAYYPEYRRV